MVEVVVQNGDERCIEGEVLLERARALHLQRNTCHAVSEEDVSAVGFFGLGAPLIAEGTSSKVSGSLTMRADGAPISYEWSAQTEKTNGAPILFANGVEKITSPIKGATPFQHN